MFFLKKYRLEIIVFFIISALFFFSRFYHILNLPIFTDEAIYLRWAQIAKNDPAWRFISLTDGKQPLFIWLMMITMSFIKDPLLAGRLVSVGAGFVTMIGLFFLAYELFKNIWIGILAAFLYLIFPFALVYDRMALYDSLVGTCAVWGLYVAVLLATRVRLDVALILGMVIGGGTLTKTSGFFNIYLLPFTLILFNWTKKNRHKDLLKWTGLSIISVVLGYGFYSILRLSPFFHIIAEKNALFVYPFREWLQHPFTFLWGNLSVGQWNWLKTYLTWPIFLIIVFSFLLDRKYLREKILLALWFLVPFVALALFGRTLYPRFIFFMTLYLLPLASYSFFKFYQFSKNKFLFSFLFLLISFLSLRSDFLILTDFAHAPIPVSDLGQYNNDWPAGGGVREAVAFFKNEAQAKGKIYIGTQGTFGLMPYSLEIYLVNNPNITIKGFWPIEDVLPKELRDASKKMPTYVVFYQPCSSCRYVGEAPISWPLTLVQRFEKEIPTRYFSIYKVNP